jgi:hypothetical protein
VQHEVEPRRKQHILHPSNPIRALAFCSLPCAPPSSSGGTGPGSAGGIEALPVACCMTFASSSCCCSGGGGSGGCSVAAAWLLQSFHTMPAVLHSKTPTCACVGHTIMLLSTGRNTAYSGVGSSTQSMQPKDSRVGSGSEQERQPMALPYHTGSSASIKRDHPQAKCLIGCGWQYYWWSGHGTALCLCHNTLG